MNIKNKSLLIGVLLAAAVLVSQGALGWGGGSYSGGSTTTGTDSGSTTTGTDSGSTTTGTDSGSTTSATECETVTTGSTTSGSTTSDSFGSSGGGSYGGSYGSYDGWGSGGSSGWSESVCRVCHTNYAAQGVLPLPPYNPDNHHKLIGTKIRHTTAPNWENKCVKGNKYEYNCLTCHVLATKELDGEEVVDPTPERNCLNCHKLSTVTGGFGRNRHMQVNHNCSVCHCRMPPPGPRFGSCGGDGGWGGGGGGW